MSFADALLLRAASLHASGLADDVTFVANGPDGVIAGEFSPSIDRDTVVAKFAEVRVSEDRKSVTVRAYSPYFCLPQLKRGVISGFLASAGISALAEEADNLQAAT